MRKAIFWFSVIFLSGGWPASGRAQDMTNNNCVLCHADQWEAMQGSVHSRHQITCDRCHGGDPTKEDMEEAKAPGTNFIGIPDKQQTVRICGECHADVEAMNFYAIPTDQLARYKTSAHGKLLFDHGDEHAAVCTDCHGYHDVLPVTDPQSPVYPLNVPQTCNRCHGDKTVMAPYKHPTDILEKYKNSVHGIALFQKNDLGAANCVMCHGSHGAVPPGVNEIGETCGKCHINEKKFFMESPHFQAAQDGYFPECVACHDYHDIQKPSTALYGSVCLNCHDQSEDAFSRGQTIQTMIDRSASALATAEGVVKQAAIDGIFVDEESAMIEEAKTKVIEMAPAQHSLSVDKIGELSRHVSDVTERIQEGVRKKRQDLKWRKIALIPLWIFVVMMAAILYIRYKQRKGKKDE